MRRSSISSTTIMIDLIIIFIILTNNIYRYYYCYYWYSLDCQVRGLSQTPTAILVPILLHVASSQHNNTNTNTTNNSVSFVLESSAAALCLKCLNIIAGYMSRPFVEQIHNYAQLLFIRANTNINSSDNNSVNIAVVQGMVSLLSLYPAVLEQHWDHIIEYMMKMQTMHVQNNNNNNSNHSNGNETAIDLARESCEFWISFCEACLPGEVLLKHINRIIPILLGNMCYSDDDDDVLEVIEEEEQLLHNNATHTVVERDEELKPFFGRVKNSYNSNNDDDNDDNDGDDDDDEYTSYWNLRKCSAASLDSLSDLLSSLSSSSSSNNLHTNSFLAIALSEIKGRYDQGERESSWKMIEVSALALGAISNGCSEAMRQYVSSIVQLMLPHTTHRHALVRSISCWSLSRYVRLLGEDAESNTNNANNNMNSGRDGSNNINQVAIQLLDAVIVNLMTCMHDKIRKVQESACSALSSIGEDSELFQQIATSLTNRMPHIMQSVAHGFDSYGRRALPNLTEMVGTLAEHLSDCISDPTLCDMNIFMKSFMNRFQKVADSDQSLLPLMECVTCIIPVIGTGVAPYAEVLFARSDNVCKVQLAYRQSNGATDSTSCDRDLVMLSLDLISSIIEALGRSMEELLIKYRTIELVCAWCDDSDPSVRQSAFAVIGDLARAVPNHIHPITTHCFELAGKMLEAAQLIPENMGASNNVCWAVGELALVSAQNHTLNEQVAVSVAERLVAIMNMTKVNKSLFENAAISLGRIALARPAPLAPHLDQFIAPWCYGLCRIRDDIEKEHAFMGLFQLIRLNPNSLGAGILPLACGIASWQHIKNEKLKLEMNEILHVYKNGVSAEQWQTLMTSLGSYKERVLAIMA